MANLEIEMSKRERKLVCYYLARTDLLPVTDIDPFLCTHLMFAFAKFKNGKLTESSPADIKIYGEMMGLKSKNKKLKVVLSVQHGFPELVNADEELHKKFYKQAISFLREYRFDGIDLDWEFPHASEKEKYSNFLKGFRESILQESQSTKKEPLLLTAALPNSPSKIKNYDMKTLANTLDFATAMTYDLHMFIKNVDKVTGFNSALFPAKGEGKIYSVSGLIDYYLQLGFPAEKLLFGLPTYGRTYTLKDPEKHGVHAPAIGTGEGGPKLHKKGVYSYPEACLAQKNGAEYVWDTTSSVPYLYHDNLWCSFEDPKSAAGKALYFFNKLGGVGVWTITLDDTKGHLSGGQKFPIINAVKKVLMDIDI